MTATHNDVHAHKPGPETGSLPLLLAMGLTLGYAAVEAAAGWWSGSLALLGDAGHMLTDAVALLIAVLAARIARLPPSPRHSFGMARAQLVAALVNAAFMLAVVGMLSVEAVARLVDPVDVKGEAVTVVAGAGLLLNMAVAWMLSRGTPDLNVRAALLHVMGDLLGSVAAIASGVLVMFTGWTRADPALTFVIAGLIGFSSLRLAREALHGLIRPGLDDAVDQDIALVKEMLGLDPKADTFRLKFGVAREHPDEIVLLTRSMQSMMGEMSAGVDIPEQDLLDRRVISRRADSASSNNAPLMNVRSGNERPADAFAAVQYRDHWFWIDDRDLVSKRMFRFLLMFSSMAESGNLPQGPLLTIPAG